ncbi:MAG: peptidoglycan DD-metalloendopeptidase family protein [Erysipelotrichaceae bacterium]|nr:peptidoglycan DD-metalloendopeptidase family protein [Erysipelotrichaceae bacterium]
MKKTIAAVIVSLLLALGLVYLLPKCVNNDRIIEADIVNETSLVPQGIISYEKNEKTYQKIYAEGKLVGIVTDMNYINQLINEKYKKYENDFPDTTLGFSEDVYIIEEKSYATFEDVDKQIVDYIDANNYLGVHATAVELYTDKGIYDIIYVKSYDDFLKAFDTFLTNFIPEETLTQLRNNETIPTPVEIGSVSTGLYVEEKLRTKEAVVSPSEIFMNESEIYSYLCYGRDDTREYYTVAEGDTLQAVGYYFGDMTAKQIVMLNQDILSSENQVITPGMVLNVRYYTSPLTVDVTKERLSQEMVVPDSPIYIEDDTLEKGKYEILTEEQIGIKNVLYRETWVNGVLTSGEKLSETVITEPVQGVIAVGTLQVTMVGTGNFIFPVENPHIICDFGCYIGHTGTDFTNLYVRYAPIYAADSGVVESVGYRYDMGYYVYIDHQNGFKTYYMHMNTYPYVSAGENVTRGQVIGQMGSTGRSEGVHVHFTIEVNGVRVNACGYLPCYLAR